ncbi:MAG: hypothetical protein GEU79_01340 [Acidimicrobiia bacterium]|nr:hypothetical protein [Acidimicrobiia bacterium]
MKATLLLAVVDTKTRGVNDPKQPTRDEPPKRLQVPLRVTGRFFLHMALVLMLAAPAAIALVRSPSAGVDEIIGAEEIEETAPDFTLSLFDGDTFTLSDHVPKTADRW